VIAGYNLAFLGPIGAVFAIAPGPIVALFVDDPPAVAYATDCLRIVAFGFIAFAYGMVAVQAFNGAGDTRTPMIVNLLSFWGFKIPLAWLLAKSLGLGPRGAFLAITAAYSLQSIVAGLLFRRGRWQSMKLSEDAA
jgi:Na+-driven multidrug efflux pump